MTLNDVKEKIEGITNDFECGASDKKETNEAILALLIDFCIFAIEKSNGIGGQK